MANPEREAANRLIQDLEGLGKQELPASIILEYVNGVFQTGFL